MRVERERACDDLVLGRGLPATAYANQLVRMTAEYPAVRLQVPLTVGMARQSGLEQRVRRILNDTTDRRGFTQSGLTLLVAGLATLVLPLAMLQREKNADSPAIEERPHSEVAEEEKDNHKTADRLLAQNTKPKTEPQSPRKSRENAAPSADLLYEVKCQQNEIEVGGRIAVETKLTNRGKEAVTVYWGDYAHPDMYRFDISHAKTKERLPATRYGLWLEKLSTGGNGRYFKKIEPGKSETYTVMLLPAPGSNAQHVFFRKPGTYVITPSLNVVAYRALERTTGKATLHPNTWTGKLDALPFGIRVTEKEEPVADDQLALRGTAVNHDGTPAAGALIKVFEFIPSFGSYDGVSERQVDQVYSNALGKFRIERLPRASSEFRVMAWTESGLSYVTRVTNKGTAAEIPIDIKFAEPVEIQGLVVDTNGKPLEGVRISSREYTNQHGRFALTMGRSNEYRFQIWQRGYLDSYHVVPHKTATAGVWRSVLTPEKDAKITGTATFPDGTPLRNLKLQFSFTAIRKEDRKEYPQGARSETKSDGTFEVTLPEPKKFSTTVTAFEPSEHNIGRVWKTTVAEVGPGSKPLSLTFDNRHRVQVKLSQTEPLPESLELTLGCQLDSRRTMEEKQISASSKETVFAGLTPGKYRIVASVKTAGHRHFEAHAEIQPGKDQQTVTAELRIPAFKFGDLTATFLRPDGKTPYQGHIRLYSTGSLGRHTADNAGRLTVRTVPVGRVQLTASGAEGLAESPSPGIVKANEMTDLGTIRLKAEEEVYGWVVGQVKYPDGSPLLGATANGIAHGVDTSLTSQPNGFQANRVSAKGEFKLRMNDGLHNVTFDLTNVATWPGGKPAGNSFSSFRPSGFPKAGFHRLTARLKAERGKTRTHDIVVPRFKPGRSLKINFNRALPTAKDVDPKNSFSQHAPMVTAMVKSGDVWLSGSATMKDNGDGTSSATIDKVPAGRGHVVFRSFNPSWMTVADFAEDDNSPVLSFDPDESATLLTRILDEEGKPLKGLGLYVSTMLADHELGIARVFPLAAGQTQTDKPRHWTMDERPDGTVIIRGLGPVNASLSFEISGDSGIRRWAHRVPLNLEGKAGARVTWHVDGSGKLLSKEVELVTNRKQLLK